MARTGRKTGEHEYLVVYILASEGGIQPYVELSFFGKEEQPTGLPSKENTERSFFKKEMIENLSNESKDIIRLIFSSPSEVLQEITSPVHECVSKQRIKNFLLQKGWKRVKIEKSFSEIRKFVIEMEKIS